MELAGFFAIAWVILVVRPEVLGARDGHLVSGVYSTFPVFLFKMARRHIGIYLLEHEIDLLDIGPHAAMLDNITTDLGFLIFGTRSLVDGRGWYRRGSTHSERFERISGSRGGLQVRD